jgi:hypothetical protein
MEKIKRIKNISVKQAVRRSLPAPAAEKTPAVTFLSVVKGS